MDRPLVIAYHLIWMGYGWWLPNDPRGSTSAVIRQDVLAELGGIHFGRKPIQPASREIREFYSEAAEILKFPLLSLDQHQIAVVAASFAGTIIREKYTCYACAIMPDHVHLIIRKHRHSAEEMMANLRQDSRQGLRETSGLADHPIWGGPGWKVFLDGPEDVWRTIKYIEANPVKQRVPPQRWTFVTRYDNWPLHPGHSPKSPYVKRLQNDPDQGAPWDVRRET